LVGIIKIFSLRFEVLTLEFLARRNIDFEKATKLFILRLKMTFLTKYFFKNLKQTLQKLKKNGLLVKK